MTHVPAHRGTYRPQPPLASLRATGGQRQTLPPRPPASIDRILTLAFLAGGLLLGGRWRYREGASMPPPSPHTPAADDLRECGPIAGTPFSTLGRPAYT
jgi:hypothetical protein